jgi:hypothetical protein
MGADEDFPSQVIEAARQCRQKPNPIPKLSSPSLTP